MNQRLLIFDKMTQNAFAFKEVDEYFAFLSTVKLRTIFLTSFLTDKKAETTAINIVGQISLAFVGSLLLDFLLVASFTRPHRMRSVAMRLSRRGLIRPKIAPAMDK